jgi:hypothetical protein
MTIVSSFPRSVTLSRKSSDKFVCKTEIICICMSSYVFYFGTGESIVFMWKKRWEYQPLIIDILLRVMGKWGAHFFTCLWPVGSPPLDYLTRWQYGSVRGRLELRGVEGGARSLLPFPIHSLL